MVNNLYFIVRDAMIKQVPVFIDSKQTVPQLRAKINYSCKMYKFRTFVIDDYLVVAQVKHSRSSQP